MKVFKTFTKALKFVYTNYEGPQNRERIVNQLMTNKIAKVNGMILIIDKYDILH